MNDQVLTSSMTILAAIALTVAVAVAIYAGLAAYRTGDSWRRWAYAISTILAGYTAVGYFIVLFINPLASVAWLRPAILAWMLHFLVVIRLIETVVTASPSEQVRIEMAQMKHHIANLEQSRNILEGVTAHYQEGHETLKATLTELDEKYQGNNELVINLRHALGNMLDEQMQLKEELVRAEYDRERKGSIKDE